MTRLALVGVPMRLGSISGGRFDKAPGAIRECLGRYVAGASRLAEAGVETELLQDLDAASELRPEQAFDPIVRSVRPLLQDPDGPLVLLGGDNSITRPGVHATAASGALERTGLLTFDAHHDLRETNDGLSNGNPVRALLEDGLPGRNVVQIGIQPLANSPRYSELAAEAGITVMTADDVREAGIEKAVSEGLLRLTELDSIYVDLDVDVLDRAFAPACPGSRPGGLTPADLQRAATMCGEDPRVRAIDVVEVDPERDVKEATAMAAASFVISFAAGLARR